MDCSFQRPCSAPACRRPARKARIRSARLARRAACLALLVTAACAPRRYLKIESTPPGAIVRVDEQVVGETPLRYDFTEYGTRRVTLYKEGYRSYSNLVRLRAPWYAVFPLDYVSELLLPFGWRDSRQLVVTLEEESGEVTLPDLQGVLDRAELFRLAGPDGPQLSDVVPMEPQPLPPPASPEESGEGAEDGADGESGDGVE